MSDVIVTGGGASGMMAAISAAKSGANVLLLERNEKLGKKIYITGKGRCNVTNQCTQDEFMQEVARNPRFLFSALNFFTPDDLRRMLEDAGCPTVCERGRRVFPCSQHASDVTKALTREMEKYGVRVRLNARVRSVNIENGRTTGVVMEDGSIIHGDKVILSCGGLSYPSTGSTGDGYHMAQEAGHTVMPTHGVLSPLLTEEKWCGALMGLSLKNVGLTMKIKGKTAFGEIGEMLFTHFGISGPMVLTMSCHMPDDLAQAEITLDMKPGMTQEQLDARILREFGENPQKSIKNLLHSFLPGKMAEVFSEITAVDTDRTPSQLTREERGRIVSAMKCIPIHVTSFAPIEEAIVTRGGVCVREISPKTMESKLVSGLYFTGEMIDVDAHTGGYNLQIAFSTGALAGASAASD